MITGLSYFERVVYTGNDRYQC